MRLKVIIITIMGIALMGVIFYLSQGDEKRLMIKDISKQIAGTSVEMSPEQLKEYNGLNGKKCYVAVNGKVYNIPLNKTALWLEGKHVPSGGMAMCGRDLSTVIGSSPHGLAKLESLELISNYKP